MLSIWLSQPLLVRAGTLTAAYVAFAILLAFLSFKLIPAKYLRESGSVIAPFSNVIAILFVLLVTFLTVEIWDKDKQLRQAIGREREDLAVLSMLGDAYPSPRRDTKEAVRSYIDAVVNVEWAKPKGQADETEAALARLERLPTESGAAEYESIFVNALTDLRAARERRISIANRSPDDGKWYGALLLALLAQAALAASHLDRLRPQLLAQSIFVALAVTSLSLASSAEHLFTNAVGSPLRPLNDFQKKLSEQN
jgi:hypothetical protein